MAASKKNPAIIQSLDKGLQLLEIIENETYPVTLHTLWLKLGWDKSTIFRMCTTLEKRGRRLYSSAPTMSSTFCTICENKLLDKSLRGMA